MTTHRLHFCFCRFCSAMLIENRTHGASIVVVQMSDQNVGKINGVNSSLQLLQSNALADESFPDKPLPAFPTNLAIAANLTRQIVPGILLSRKLDPPSKSAFAIQSRRGLLSQCLVRSMMVVASQPESGSMLLATRSVCGRGSGFSLHDSMKLFVRTVVLGMGRSGEFHAYSQSDPPRAQARQARRPGGSEGATVVDSYHFGPGTLAKKPDKDCFYSHPSLIGQQASEQCVAAEQISHRQWLHPFSVPDPKPTFEIDGPHLVGSSSQRQLRISFYTSFAWTSPDRPRQPHALHPTGNRPRRRRAPSLLHKPSLQLFGSPTRMLVVRQPNPLDPLAPQTEWHSPRTARPVLQATASFLQKTRFPLVSCFAADTKNPTPLTDGLFASEQNCNQSQSLPNNRMIVPRHNRRKPTVLC